MAIVLELQPLFGPPSPGGLWSACGLDWYPRLVPGSGLESAWVTHKATVLLVPLRGVLVDRSGGYCSPRRRGTWGMAGDGAEWRDLGWARQARQLG